MQKHHFPQHVARVSVLGLVILSIVLFFFFQQDFTNVETRPQQKVSLNSFAHLPMRFEKNMGQVDSETDFLYRDRLFSLHLSPDQAIMSLQQPA